ncbi:MAG: hypothetical protein KAR24_00845 [Candidatus Pacebacteria bacterium]|nr:hypothetical protein [Candidatus Paceibacterota bacterium]
MKVMFKKIVVAILIYEAKLVLKKYHPRVIAITGSVGKTSTEDALYTVLNKSFFVRKSKKSFSGEFNVLLTILNCPTGWNNPFLWLKNIIKGVSLLIFRHHYPELLILEVGAERPGDVENVSKWLVADIVVITRFGDVPTHVEFFDSVEHLVREKAFLINSLKKDGLLILNGDDEKVRVLKDTTDHEYITYGFEKNTDIRADNVQISYNDGVPIGLSFELKDGRKKITIHMKNVFGRHHVYVALCALAVGRYFKLDTKDILESLSSYTPPPGRLRLVEGLKGCIIIDDTYNASPVAVLAGLETVGELNIKGKKIAILGDMLELGKFTIEAHKEVGVMVGKMCDLLFVVGPRAQSVVDGALIGGMSEKNIVEFADSKEAGKHAERIIKEEDVIFIKGSQGMRMEYAVEEIMAHPENKKQVLVRQEKEWQSR